MALSISQILASSYPAVLAAKRAPENQWAENAFMREMERTGMIEKVSFGPTIEAPLDWRANPGAGFNATELETLSLDKTNVITAASYAIAELSVPVTYSNKDEVTNPTENQKIALVKSLINNALTSHDDKIESAIFATSTNGFNGLLGLVPQNGNGTPGGIDASVEAWWRNPQQTYTGASDIEAKLTLLYNQVIKGSGSEYTPTTLISSATPHATFEGTQQGLQRYVDTQEAKAGFKILAFKTARWSFSQYGTTDVFMLSPKAFNLKVSKQMFRDLGDEIQLQSQNGKTRRVYSALQAIVVNKSRLGICHL
jgi:hypothetical protein